MRCLTFVASVPQRRGKPRSVGNVLEPVRVTRDEALWVLDEIPSRRVHVEKMAMVQDSVADFATVPLRERMPYRPNPKVAEPDHLLDSLDQASELLGVPPHITSQSVLMVSFKLVNHAVNGEHVSPALEYLTVDFCVLGDRLLPQRIFVVGGDLPEVQRIAKLDNPVRFYDFDNSVD